MLAVVAIPCFFTACQDENIDFGKYDDEKVTEPTNEEEGRIDQL